MPPIDFKHKCHDNRRVANRTKGGNEHVPLNWEHAVITTTLLFHDSRHTLMVIYIQLQVLE